MKLKNLLDYSYSQYKNSNAIFYHGLGGEPSPQRDNLLIKKGYNLISEQHDYYLEYDKDKMKSFFENQLNICKDIDIILGTSLGGYVAYKIAKTLGKICVIINPALDRSLSKTRIKDVIINNNINRNINLEVFIAKDDLLINPTITLNYLKIHEPQCTVHMMDGFGHRVPDKFFKKIINDSIIL